MGMTKALLICVVWLFACCSAWAAEQQKRFLEIPSERDTTTYDLNSVKIVQPGKFTIIITTVDNPDFMRLEMKVLDTLRTYCARGDGNYPAPADVLALGPPDMPVKNIVVKSDEKTKRASWSLPYSRLVLGNNRDKQYPVEFFCKRSLYQTQTEEYLQTRSAILNGIRSKALFDCKRGLTGIFMDMDDDPTKPLMRVVRKGTVDAHHYESICRAVTHEEPYMPQ